MDDLTEFVNARLDEEEAAAREACDGDSGEWFTGDKWNVYRKEDEARYDWDSVSDEHKLVVYGNVKPQSEHIARHDPARALREVTAMRKRLAIMTEAHNEMNRIITDGAADRADQAMAIGRARAATVAVKYDAEIWSGHPDYKQKWAL